MNLCKVSGDFEESHFFEVPGHGYIDIQGILPYHSDAGLKRRTITVLSSWHVVLIVAQCTCFSSQKGKQIIQAGKALSLARKETVERR